MLVLVPDALRGVTVADTDPARLVPPIPGVSIDARFPFVPDEAVAALIDGRATVVLAPSGAAVRWVGAQVDHARPWSLTEAPDDLTDPRGRLRIERRVCGERAWALVDAGVQITDPERLWIGPDVVVAPGARLWADVVLRGRTRIDAGAEIGQGAVLEHTSVGAGSKVKPYTVCSGATIGAACQVGPFTHLRPGATLEHDVKVGNFVEVKASTLRRGVRASHLSYLGDSEIGARTNVGAGTITCNYDGFAKHRTTVGADVFVGSNSCLVAPVTIGDGVVIGALSCVTQDAPADALVVERAPLRVLGGRGRMIRDRNRRAALDRA